MKFVQVLKEPSAEILYSMALRYRHDFGLDKDSESGPLQCGVTPDERESILQLMKTLYEEATGQGFYHL